MNANQKHKIVDLINEEKKRTGSYSSVAVRSGVSTATISQMINMNWELIRDQIWNKVAISLGVRSEGIEIVATTNFRVITETMQSAAANHMFIGISAAAGSGKTVALRHFANTNTNTYYLEAREWAKREFLRNLSRSLGLQTVYYHTGNQLEDQIIQFFVKNAGKNQVLIVDQANSLKLSSLKFFIHLYNAMKGRMAIVLSGTDALESKIKKGVYNKTNGFDEVDSRLGRNFIHLLGATIKDVRLICEANGIPDKDLAADIFKEAGYDYITVENRTFKVVRDLRRIERIILREQLKKIA